MSSRNSESHEPAAESVASPCRRQCCLDDRDMCLGCGRLLAEILEWGAADNSRRRAICQNAQARLRPRGG